MSEVDDLRNYPASAEDLHEVAAFPAGTEMTKIVLGSMAKHRTKVVVGRADGSEATLTFAEVTDVLGLDL